MKKAQLQTGCAFLIVAAICGLVGYSVGAWFDLGCAFGVLARWSWTKPDRCRLTPTQAQALADATGITLTKLDGKKYKPAAQKP